MSHGSARDSNSSMFTAHRVRPWRRSRRELITGVAAGLGLAAGWPAQPLRATAIQVPPGRIQPAGFQVDNHGSPAWQARHGLTSADYQAAFEELGAQGYRLIDVSGYFVNGEVRYTGIWEQSPGPAWVGRHGLTAEDHQAAFDELSGQGFVPTVVSGYNAGDGARFASIFEQRPHGAMAVRHGINGDQMQELFDTLQPQGFVPTDLSAYVIDGQARYTAIWEQIPVGGWQVTHGMLVPELNTVNDANFAAGLRPVRLSGFELDGQTWYAVIWHDRSQMNVVATYEIAGPDFQTHFSTIGQRGFRLVKNSGFPAGGADRFATVWHKPYLAPRDEDQVSSRVQAVMTPNGLPGFSLAVAKDGRLIYARGFGIANSQTGEAVSPHHLFRIASLSKPITAVTIFRLIEDGQLALSDTVFGTNGWLGFAFGTPPAGSNIERITIQHLLEHTTGWTREIDPMFEFPELDQAGLIEHMVENVALATVPGATHSYSNFGYNVLGRVIERVTGQTYAGAVQQRVLGPAGTTNMHIAGDTLAERRPDEVTYTAQARDPYTVPVARMDAHGGWIASAIDLLRFVTAVDGSPNRPQLLTAASRSTMLTPSSAINGGGYGKGWAVNTAAGTWFHNGDFAGSITMLVRGTNGFAWALLANSRNDESDANLNANRGDLDQLGWNILSDVPDWPSTDLF